jgi:orotidine-5'-phosphate decarboxylase
MRALRAICPDMPFLVPGIGAQEGELQRSVQAGRDARGGGLIINASRAVLYASDGRDHIAAARAAAQRLRDEIEQHRLAVQASR